MERLSAESIRSNFQEIYRFGCRWLGTEGEKNTREAILTKFEDSLMDSVYLEWFQCHNYIPKESKLEVMSPINLDIRCEPLEYSENSEIEGELVFLGELKEDDTATLSNINIDLEGKICLIISDTPAFHIPELVERGAAGVIVATDAPDNLIRMLAAKSYPPTLEDPLRWRVKIPGVSISRQDLYRLLSYMSLGKVIVKIEHLWDSRISQTCNVVGIVEGNTDESIVVGAHYDSQMKTPGAWDNLTGVSTLLDLARTFGKAKNRRRIIFVAFGAEEIGLWGSSFFVEELREELKEKCNAMFCLDAISSAFPAERSLWSEGLLKNTILEKAQKFGYPIDNSRGLTLSYSDYYPFFVESIPAVMIWEYPPINPYYHTEKDSIKYIDFNKLYLMGELHKKIIQEVSNV